MALTTTQVLSEIQLDLLEPDTGGASWASGHWEVQEVYDYLTHRFSQFLKDSQVITTYDTQPVIPNTLRQELDDNWIMGLRVSWRAYTDGTNVYKEVPRADSFEIDNSEPIQFYEQGIPQRYTEGELPPPELEIWPAPSVIGQLGLLSISMPSGFDPASGSVFTPLPDELVTYVKYGTMADMLAKQGRGQDAARAKYCEARYLEGVQLCKLIMKSDS